jgi:hypothetical protein
MFELNSKTLLSIAICLLAFYGLIILVRKILSTKEKSIGMFFEPYRHRRYNFWDWVSHAADAAGEVVDEEAASVAIGV